MRGMGQHLLDPGQFVVARIASYISERLYGAISSLNLLDQSQQYGGVQPSAYVDADRHVCAKTKRHVLLEQRQILFFDYLDRPLIVFRSNRNRQVVPAANLYSAVFPCEQVPRRQRICPFPKGFLGVIVMAVREVGGPHGGVGVRTNPGSVKCRDFAGREESPILAMVVIERFYSESVSRREHLSLARVPDQEGEHP